MKDEIQPNISDGEFVKAWKEPGIYILDFPTFSIKVAEDQINDVLNDLENIIKKIRKK